MLDCLSGQKMEGHLGQCRYIQGKTVNGNFCDVSAAKIPVGADPSPLSYAIIGDDP